MPGSRRHQKPAPDAGNDGVAREEVSRQNRDVFAALTERWKVNLDGIQPEEKVFAELSGGTGSR